MAQRPAIVLVDDQPQSQPRHEPQDLTEVRQALTGFSEARSGGVNICAETVPKALETL